jgi:ribosomal protein S18 acetylase RimI-like enzyme
VEIERQTIKIVKCHPNKPDHFSKLSDAYLKLFNEKENLKLLSFTNLPFDSNTITSFLKNTAFKDVAYYVVISSYGDIIGISAFECDLIKGFNIIEVVVDTEYRGFGVGSSLINKGIELAEEKGFKAVDINVFTDNKPMLILLLKMDFKIVKIDHHTRCDGEDLIYLKKYL